jgi:amino acid adenylation domain-containing protein
MESIEIMDLVSTCLDCDEGRTLRTAFLNSWRDFANRPALVVDGGTFTFDQLGRSAASLAATLQACGVAGGPELTAVFAHRSHTAFAGVLGALLSGDGYVPLNPTFPTDRTATMLVRAGCRKVIVDRHSAGQLEEVLAGIDEELALVFPDHEDVSDFVSRFPGHKVIGAMDLARAGEWIPSQVDPDAVAYLLFTSGSTGIPKGVMVAHRNVIAFIESMVERYEVTETDRLSQMFEMTFDLSVFDMFIAWEKGACLCCPSKGETLTPSTYIQESGITIWFSVPSSALLMKRLRMLGKDAYPGLRLSLFCGEALPVEVVQAWGEAAPNSVIENLYGPTELTIACTLYQWDSTTSLADAELGVVPIGYPYPGMSYLVVDEEMRLVAKGEVGELLMTGPQLTLGYWKDPEKTAAAFIVPPEKDEVYYRTGDRVRRPVGERPLVYLGRVDNQIKVHGYRVELGEIEAALRETSGIEGAVAVGWPVTDSGAGGIVAFLEGTEGDIDKEGLEKVAAALKERMPSYMVPRTIRLLAPFPLNSNGKIDRKALLQLLQDKK